MSEQQQHQHEQQQRTGPDAANAPDEDRLPPYDGRTTERGSSDSSDALSETVERQLSGTEGGGAGQTASPAEEHPVDPDEVTDEVPESPHGVGESTTRRAEDIARDEGKEPGRQDAGVEDTPAQRPVGTSTPRDMTSVNPDEA